MSAHNWEFIVWQQTKDLIRHAAKRAGISCVLLPEHNRRDLEEIPSAGRAGIRFEFLTTADEALRLALEPEASL
jgi:ATP-dependent Lon protease